jgi:hypothetical protein
MHEQIITMVPFRPALAALDAPLVATLPPQFAVLQPYVALWALATETERNTQRHTVGMNAIRAFADAILPEVEPIVAYLNGYSIDALPDDAKALMQMLLSLAEVAPAIEFYKQPEVIDGYEPRRFAANETFVMRPVL